MSLYIKDSNNQEGLLEFGTGRVESDKKLSHKRFRFLKVGQLIDLKYSAAGLPEGFAELKAVKIVSIHGIGSKGAIGCVGGKLRIEHNGAWLGFSGNAILELSLTR